MTLDLSQRLRLQIRTEAVQPAGKTNLIINPDGSLGTYGWTRTAGTTMTWTGTDTYIRSTASPITTTQFASNTGTAAVGNTITGKIMLAASVTPTVGIPTKTDLDSRAGWQYMNGATPTTTVWGAWVSHTGTYDAGSPVGSPGSVKWPSVTHTIATGTIPSGSNGVRLVFEFRPNGSGGGVIGAYKAYMGGSEMFATTGAPPAPTVAETPWLDILGPTAYIEVNKSELDVGLLKADIYDVVLDPKTNPEMHKGASVRLQTSLSDGTWEDVYIGTVMNISTNYGKKGQPHISLSASDAVGVVAGIPRSGGVSTIDELRELFDDYTNFKWAVNGTSTPGVSAVVTYENPNASLLDAVTVARDTEKGFAWVDRHGVLQAYNPATMPVRGGQIAFIDVFDPNMATRTNLVTNPNDVVGGAAWSKANSSLVEPPVNRTGVTLPAAGFSSYFYATTWPDGFVYNKWYEGVDQTFGVDIKNLDPTRTLVVGCSAIVPSMADPDYKESATSILPGQTKRVTFSLNDRTYTGSIQWSATTAPLDTGSVWHPYLVLGYATGATAVAADYTLKNAMIEYRTAATPGVAMVENTPFSGASVGASWTGTVNNSTSTMDAARYVSYSDIDAGFSTDDVINGVNIKMLGLEGELSYGPFTDTTSVAKYGGHSIDVSITGSVVPATYASGILTAFANPTTKVESITFPVKDERSLGKAAIVDLYMDVEVVYKSVFSGEMTVADLSHKISPDKWLVTVGFRPKGSTASFTGAVPSPPADVYDTGWVLIPIKAGFAWRVGYEGQCRRIGKIIYVRGMVNRSVGTWSTGTPNPCDIPVGFRPAAQIDITFMVNGTALQAYIDTAGKVNALNTATTGGFLGMGGLTWPMD